MPNPLAKAMLKSKASNEPYRKVKITVWDDPKSQTLSSLPSSGQSPFIYLLTSPFTGIIPGLYKAGRAAMAEELNWGVEAFDLVSGEAIVLGMMEVDLKARVFWLPNAVKRNPPASVDVIKSWARSLGLLPECSLKDKAHEALKAACCGASDAMGMALDKAFALPKDKAKPLAKPLPSGIQKVISSRRVLNPSLNAGATRNLNRDELPSSAMPRYLDSVDESIGESSMTDSWLPSRDFRQRAASRGISLPEPDYLLTEFVEFIAYRESERKAFIQIQWKQKFARHVARARTQIKSEIGGNSHVGARSEPIASWVIQQIQSAHAEWRRRNGLDGDGNSLAIVADHGGGVFGPVDPEERGGAFAYLDSPDGFDD